MKASTAQGLLTMTSMYLKICFSVGYLIIWSQIRIATYTRFAEGRKRELIFSKHLPFLINIGHPCVYINPVKVGIIILVFQLGQMGDKIIKLFFKVTKLVSRRAWIQSSHKSEEPKIRILKCITLEVQSTFMVKCSWIHFFFFQHLLSVKYLLGILQDARGRIG